MKVCSVCQRCYDDAAEVCVERSHAELSHVRDGGLDLVDGYRVDSLIESRPFVQIFKAHQKESGVACRVRITKAEASCVDRFLRDAKAAASVFHPNLAGIYDTGTVGSDEVFVIGEDCEGRSLREILTDIGPPDLLTTIPIVRQTAEALYAVHRSGLVHGAVRPENIVLERASAGGIQIKLRGLDIGDVIRRSLVTNKFLIESALDLLRYYSPEQFGTDAMDAQSDVYSLGVVYYEMLCGRPPFEASTAAGLIHLHRNQPPAPVKINDYNLRMLVTHALTESLQKEPRLRQSSANALARQLRHIEQLATHSSTPPAAGVASASRVTPQPVIDPETRKVTRSAVARPPRFVDTVGVSIEAWQEQRSVARATEPPVEPAVVEAKVEMPADDIAIVPTEREPASLAEAPVEIIATDRAEAAGKPEDPVTEISVPANRRSRLRSLKRKLHEMSDIVAKRHAAVTTLLSSAEAPVEQAPPETSPVIVKETVAPNPVLGGQIEVQHAAQASAGVNEENTPSKSRPAANMQPATPVVPVETPPPAVPIVPAAPPILKPQRQPIAVPPVKKRRGTISEPKSPQSGKIRTITKVKPVSPAVMAAIREAARASTVQRPMTSTPVVIRPDPDEITLVRSARATRIRIDIDSPAKHPKTRLPEFVPTLIGARDTATSEPVPPGAMFGDYGAAQRSSIPYRAISLGVGLVVLAAAFMFGNGWMGGLIRPVNPGGDSVAAQAKPQITETAPPAVVPVKQVNAKSTAPAKSETPPRASGPVSTQDRDLTIRELPKAVRRKNTADRVSQKSSAGPEKGTPDKGTTGVATRPRIVKEPRQE